MSDAAKDMETSTVTSSSEMLNKTKLLASEEGHWSTFVKHTGETGCCREGGARGCWANVIPLDPPEKDLWICCYFLSGEEEMEEQSREDRLH